jgi:dUTP pyrophosphatase
MSTQPALTVGLHRLSPDVAVPTYHSPGAAAVDLAAATAVTVPPKGLALVPTGLVFAVPPGHFLAIVARSSLPKRGLIVANGLGVLDSDYRGAADEARVLVHNYTDADVAIAAGERIAQAFVLAVPRVTFEPFSPDDTSSRGGFGSTGR